jgi:polynucleotide 5'-kinase involved in rRNA processing
MTFVIPDRGTHQIASFAMFVQSIEEITWGSEPTCVVAVVGFSDVGKTTPLELVKEGI